MLVHQHQVGLSARPLVTNHFITCSTCLSSAQYTIGTLSCRSHHGACQCAGVQGPAAVGWPSCGGRTAAAAPACSPETGELTHRMISGPAVHPWACLVFALAVRCLQLRCWEHNNPRFDIFLQVDNATPWVGITVSYTSLPPCTCMLSSTCCLEVLHSLTSIPACVCPVCGPLLQVSSWVSAALDPAVRLAFLDTDGIQPAAAAEDSVAPGGGVVNIGECATLSSSSDSPVHCGHGYTVWGLYLLETCDEQCKWQLVVQHDSLIRSAVLLVYSTTVVTCPMLMRLVESLNYGASELPVADKTGRSSRLAAVLTYQACCLRCVSLCPNTGEARVVMQLLSGLLAAGVPGGDIGIISPYKAQVRARLGACGLQRHTETAEH